MQARQPVLVDTNIMIEAVRTGCWNALSTHFKLETVEKCCEEARGGDLHRPGYVKIDEQVLREKLALNSLPGAGQLWANAMNG